VCAPQCVPDLDSQAPSTACVLLDLRLGVAPFDPCMTYDRVVRYGSFDMVCSTSTTTLEGIAGNESSMACGVLCSLGRASYAPLQQPGVGIVFTC
jgi:hypothetical protein